MDSDATPLVKIVHLEDSDVDAEIVALQLESSGLRADIERVQNEQEFLRALDSGAHIVISDYAVPGFGAIELLEAMKARGNPVPVIVVSGAIGEEAALETLRLGAVDFLLKDRLGRLASAVREALQLAAREREVRLLGQALEASVNGVIITRCTGNDHLIEYTNPAFREITGYVREETQGRNCRFLQGDEHDQPQLEKVRDALRTGGEARVVLRNYRSDGSMFWNDLSLSPIFGPEGKVTHFVGNITDITQNIEYQTQLENKSNYDDLTGLANRNLLHDRLSQALAPAERFNRTLAVLSINIDRLRHVNSSFGHAAGDAALKEFAARLLDCVRDGDTVARIAGDTFVIVLPDLARAEDVIYVVRKIEQSSARPLRVAGQEIFLSTSIGVSVHPRDGGDADTLLRNADSALHRAKESGSKAFNFYTAEMNSSAVSRVALESSLHRALEREEFMLVYQPKIRLADGCVIGAEALVRWKHPERGMVPPVEFIPLAEETGLIVPLGEHVLRMAARQVREWRDAGIGDVKVAVNVSPRQFQEAGFPETVRLAVSEAGIEPSTIELEITESAAVHGAEQFARRLAELRALGVGLSIDDFGTGYSSLSHLKRFPVDALKIDQSFVRDINSDADAAAIAEAIVRLGASMRLQVIAEGIETRAHADHLLGIGCQFGQGYYYSKPLPPGDFVRFFVAHRDV